MGGWEDRTKSPRVVEGVMRIREHPEKPSAAPQLCVSTGRSCHPSTDLALALGRSDGVCLPPRPHRRQGPKQGFGTSVSQSPLQAWPPPPRGAEEGTQAQSTDTKKEPGCPLQFSPVLTALHSPPCRARPPPLSKARYATRLPVPCMFACRIFLHLPTCTSLPDPSSMAAPTGTGVSSSQPGLSVP